MGNKIKDVLFILILGSVCIALLLGVKSYTYPIVEENERVALKSAILDAAGIEYDSGDVEAVFDSKLTKKEAGGQTYYLTPKGYYIFKFSGQGLWGLITGLVTLGRDFETIESIKIISQEETPGLGARIAEEGYLAKFHLKKANPALVVVLRKKATGTNEIDAISGASISSQALVEIVNKSIEGFRTNMGK